MCGWPLDCPMALAPWIRGGPKGPARAQHYCSLQVQSTMHPKGSPPCVSTIAGWRGKLPFRAGWTGPYRKEAPT
eukprot:8037938-Lingulodinium_polyedra.AAC.1